MKILQISQKPPYPTVDGGCVAMADLAKLIVQSGHKISLFTLFCSKHPFEKKAFPANIYSEIFAHQVDSEPSIFGAFAALFKHKNYITDRFRSQSAEQNLEVLLKKEHFDMILLESTFSGVFLDVSRKHSKAKIILRSHNIEHVLWKKRLSQSSMWQKWMVRGWVNNFEQLEKRLWKEVDAILSISQDEASEIRKHTPKQVEYFPASMTINVNTEAIPSSFYFLGAMDWGPNREALDWFAREVWPLFHARNPQVMFHLAGKGLLPSDYRTVDGWVNNGFVESTEDFLCDKGILINPLRTGQGIRIKALEAIALGKAIISTKIGMDGLPFVAGEHFLLAETKEDFVRQMEYALRHSNDLKEMAGKAQKAALQHFSKEKLSQKLEGFFISITKP
jgi:polysaccharide biosynthesis protein PslH